MSRHRLVVGNRRLFKTGPGGRFRAYHEQARSYGLPSNDAPDESLKYYGRESPSHGRSQAAFPVNCDDQQSLVCVPALNLDRQEPPLHVGSNYHICGNFIPHA